MRMISTCLGDDVKRRTSWLFSCVPGDLVGCMKWIHWGRGRNCWSTGNKVSGLRNPMAGIQEMNGWGTGIYGLGYLRSIVGAHQNNRCVVCEIYGWGPGDQWLGLRKILARTQVYHGCGPGNEWLFPSNTKARPQGSNCGGPWQQSIGGGPGDL